VEFDGRKLACEMPLIGRHNIYNALAAFGAGLSLGVDARVLKRALKTMPAVPGRLERVTTVEGFNVFVDYAHTDDALEQVLKTLREVTPGRLLLLFGCGGNRDAGKRAKMGAAAARLADFTLITSDNPRRETPASISQMIEAGYRASRADGCTVEPDRRRAIEEIIDLAAPGDTVLIAGKGHETYQEFEDTVIPFDDRLVAQECLEALRLREKQSSGARLDCILV
jgi:UDP-N-acetylmuramoyl-L-alanyl-D-glutamate--2,6-diaminopimelate ligase